MMDPNSQNPSDPDFGKKREPLLGDEPVDLPPQEEGTPSQESGETDKPKLKLKQVLTPLYTKPATKRSPDAPKLAELPKIEIPRAVAIDPEPEVGSPPDPDTDPDKVPGDGSAQQDPSQVKPVPPTEEAPSSGQDATEEESGEDESGESNPGEEEQLVAPPQRSSRRLPLLGLLVIVILAIAGAVHYLFDPLGLGSEPVTPVQGSMRPKQPVYEEEDSTPANLAPVVLSMELEKISVEKFLEHLGTRKIRAASNPKGVIVDSVFIPEGEVMNPELGISLLLVDPYSENPSIEVADAEGNLYRFPLSP